MTLQSGKKKYFVSRRSSGKIKFFVLITNHLLMKLGNETYQQNNAYYHLCGSSLGSLSKWMFMVIMLFAPEESDVNGGQIGF